MDSLEMIARCAEVATRYHVFEAKDVKNEFRKDGVTPFIVHPASNGMRCVIHWVWLGR